MFKKILLTLASIFLATAIGKAQYIPYTNQAIINSFGLKAAPFAQVTVCPSSSCMPVATIYGNSTGSGGPIPNPLSADQNGNYTFWAVPGVYFIQVQAQGTSIFSYYTTLGVSGPSMNLQTLNGIIFPDQFPGANATIKQDTAIASAGAGPGTIFDTTLLGTGDPTSQPNNVPIFDFRQTNDFIINQTTNADRVADLLIDTQVGDFTTRPLTGTVTLTNGQTTLTGSGTHFTTELDGGSGGSLIKLSADSSSSWAKVISIGNNTTATLDANYTGTGGIGTAVSTVTQHPLVIRNLCTGGTPPDSLSGECGTLTVSNSRTAGTRSVYGPNFIVKYYTAAGATSANAIGEEITFSNNSGTDDTAAETTVGLNVLSAGSNHPNTGIQVIGASDGAAWNRSVFIAPQYVDVGLLIQEGTAGSNSNAFQVLPMAIDTNAQIGGLTLGGGYQWQINNDGSARFANGTYLDPSAESVGVLSNPYLEATSGPNGYDIVGLYTQPTVLAGNTQNLTNADGALRGILSQPMVQTGATGTITMVSSYLASYVNNGATTTTWSGYRCKAPIGTGITTNRYCFQSPSGAGGIDVADGITTANQYVSTLATGSPPLAVASTTPVVNLNASPITYDAAGTQIVNPHIVQGQCVLGSSCSITLSGAAAFSDTNYVCMARDVTVPADAVTITKSSSSAIALTGNSTDTLEYMCNGK